MHHVFPPTSSNVDISVSNNESFNEAFQFDVETNLLWDFADKTFRLDIKGNFEQTSPLVSITSQIVVVDIVKRIIKITVPEATLQAGLVPGTYVYDLIMTDVDAVRTQLMHGFFNYAIGVTGG